MFKPKKHLGQNFLTNPLVVEKIIEASKLKSTDLVVEIGPGTGILTEELLKKAKEVWAIEKDFDLVEKIRKYLGNNKNLKIIHQDALLFDLSLLDQYKVIANIPYNITSPLIRKFLEGENKPELLVLMVQKEVAERITAKSGSSERGFLTLIVEFYADAEIITEVPRKDFFPVPNVDSAVIKLKVKSTKLKVQEKEIIPRVFFNIVKAGFSAKRRQIHNSLAATFRLPKDEVIKILSEAKIDPQLRAEDLTLEDWFRLYKVLNK